MQGLLAIPQAVVDRADVVQGGGQSRPVSRLLIEGRGRGVVLQSVLHLTQSLLGVGEVVERLGMGSKSQGLEADLAHLAKPGGCQPGAGEPWPDLLRNIGNGAQDGQAVNFLQLGLSWHIQPFVAGFSHLVDHTPVGLPSSSPLISTSASWTCSSSSSSGSI